jgi:hypothetical protein
MTGLVLDNEALQVLSHPHHAKHPDVLAFIEVERNLARRTRRAPELVTSSVARIEAGIDARSPAAAFFNRFGVLTVAVDGPRADRATELNEQIRASTVDACVAELAASRGKSTIVLTSDLRDLTRLLSGTGAAVHRI